MDLLVSFRIKFLSLAGGLLITPSTSRARGQRLSRLRFGQGSQESLVEIY